LYRNVDFPIRSRYFGLYCWWIDRIFKRGRQDRSLGSEEDGRTSGMGNFDRQYQIFVVYCLSFRSRTHSYRLIFDSVGCSACHCRSIVVGVDPGPYHYRIRCVSSWSRNISQADHLLRQLAESPRYSYLSTYKACRLQILPEISVSLLCSLLERSNLTSVISTSFLGILCQVAINVGILTAQGISIPFSTPGTGDWRKISFISVFTAALQVRITLTLDRPEVSTLTSTSSCMIDRY